MNYSINIFTSMIFYNFYLSKKSSRIRQILKIKTIRRVVSCLLSLYCISFFGIEIVKVRERENKIEEKIIMSTSPIRYEYVHVSVRAYGVHVCGYTKIIVYRTFHSKNSMPKRMIEKCYASQNILRKRNITKRMGTKLIKPKKNKT
jgi:hypothetical protein